LLRVIGNPDRKLCNSAEARVNTAFSAAGKVLGGYEPGFELTKGSHPNAIERFLVLCVRGSPRLLLPPTMPVMRTAITSFLGGHRLANLVPPFVQVAAKTGGPLSRISAPVSLMSANGDPSALRSLVSNVLGRNDFQIALRLSFDRPNAKTVAMAISDSGECLCFAKFGSEAMTNELVAHESAILEQFEDTDMPVIMPQRLYSGTWAGGHNVLITAALQLDSLKRDALSAHQAADAFASHNIVESCTLSDSAYWRQLVKRVTVLEGDGSDRIISGQALGTTIARIEQMWGRLSFNFGPSHGDWTRANLGLVDGQLAALDWERCTKAAPRGIDIAHFSICENAPRCFGKSVDIERAAQSVRQFLNLSAQHSHHAEPLVSLALLEMVLRFRSAHRVGILSKDSKFGPALQASLQKWAV